MTIKIPLAPRLLALLAMTILLPRSAAACQWCAAPSPGGQGGPITTAPATTLPDGQWLLSLRSDHFDLDRLSNHELEELHEMGEHAHSVDSTLLTTLTVATGLTEDVTLGLQVPHVSRNDLRAAHHEHGGGGGHVEVENEGDPSGLGDAQLFVKWRFLRGQDPLTGISLIGSLQVPTGRTGLRDAEGERLGPEHQPGTGSWNPGLGFAGSRGFGRTSLHGSLFYQLVNEGAQDADTGDTLAADLALVHHFGGADDTTPAAGWDLVIELLAESRQSIRMNGVTDHDTGGDLLLLAAGFRVGLGRRWSLHAQVAAPLAEDPNGFEHETDYRASLGLAVTLH